MDPKLNCAVTRVMIDLDEAVRPEAAAARGIYPDVLFVRNDGWVLGAPNGLAQDAHRMWEDQWIAVVKLPPRPARVADVDVLYTAAKHIHADAAEAIRSAGNLVGPDVARGMLFMYIWMARNPRPEQWPAPEELRDLIEATLTKTLD